MKESEDRTPIIDNSMETAPQGSMMIIEDEVDRKKYPLWQGWLTLIGGIVIMILPGSVYATGNISPYIASFYHIPVSDTSNILPSFFALNSICVPIGSYFAQNFHWPRIQLTIGLSLGIAVLFFATIAPYFWLFWILYVVGFCLVQATTYLVAIH